MTEGEWKRRYAAKMAAMIGSHVGCHEAAAEAWEGGANEFKPEEAAAKEVLEWRRSV